MVFHRDICHVSYDGYLTNIHGSSDPIVTTMSLSAIEKELTGDNFVRVHRRHILNMDWVHRLESVDSGGYIAHTQNGDTVPISRQAARELRKEKKFAASFRAH